MENDYRRSLKFIPAERNMRRWWKHNKKLLNAGEMKEDRGVSVAGGGGDDCEVTMRKMKS